MYVDVKVGKRGEIVIPAFIRKKLNIGAGEELMLSEHENKIEMTPKKKGVVNRLRKIALEEKLDPKKIVYGDELYEEVLGNGVR